MHLSRFHEPIRAAGAAICALLLTTLTVSAQTPPNTPPGSPTVALSDPLFADLEARWFGSQRPITVTFSNVTGEGLTWLESRPTLTPAPPAGLQAGSPPFSFDIQTTASFEGRVGVCIDLRGMAFARPQSALQIFTTTGDSWRPLEDQAAPSPDRLCGETTTLGTFAIFYPEVRTTAITTLAGTGLAEGSLDGPGGDASDDFGENVAATRSALTRPGRMARDAAGNVYVVDNGSPAGPRVRRIDPGGTIATVVAPGICADSWPIAVDAAGRLLYCVQWSQLQPGRMDIVQVDLTFSSHTVVVAGQTEVLAMAIDGNGHLFFSEGSTGSIHRLPAGGTETQLIFRYTAVSAPLTLPDWERVWTLAFDAENHLLGGGYTLIRISPGADGRVDGSADETVRRIAGVTASNVVDYQEPFSGDGLPASRALIMPTYQMIVAADGAVVFADYSARIRRIEPGADGVVNGGDDEIVRTIAGYYHPLWWMATPSDFATGEHGLFRGVLEDPLSPGSFVVSSFLAHKVQRFGLPASDVPQPSGADLSVHVTAAPDPVDAGASLTYSATVRNHGPAGARATLTMPVSAADVSSVSASSPAGFCTIPFFAVVSFGNVVCDAGLIAPGGQVVITIQVTPKKAGSLVASFTAAGDRDDPVPSNNTVAVTTTVVEQTPPPVVITAVDDTYTVSQDSTLASAEALLTRFPFHFGASLGPLHTLFNGNGTLFFNRGGLWASDGTPEGTAVVAAGGAPGPKTMRFIDGTLYFNGPGYELWKTDGTAAGSALIKDILPGAEAANPRELTDVNGTLFFITDILDSAQGIVGAELWRTDGTDSGTVRIKTFAGERREEFFLRNVGGALFFRDQRSTDGLWVSDGTPEGTVPLSTVIVEGHTFNKDLDERFRFPWYPDWPVVLNGKLVFLGREPGSSPSTLPDLWIADRTGATRLLATNPAPGHIRTFLDLAVVNDRLYFGMADGAATECSEPPGPVICTYATMRELWTSDGTVQGTSKLRTFGPVVVAGINTGPFMFTGSNGTVHFAEDGQLWRTDGTQEGTAAVEPITVLGSGYQKSMVDVNGTLYFAGTRLGMSGIWKTDATAAGTVLVRAFDPGYPGYDLTDVNGVLYYTLPHDDARGTEVRMLGTVPGVRVNDVIGTSLAVTASVVRSPLHGRLHLNADGTFIYRPAAGFAGDDSFTYTLTDGNVTSAPATVTIHVTRAMPSISLRDAAVVEGNGAGTDLVFNVTRSGDLSGVSSVDYATGGGTATASLDYQAVSGSLTFAAGEATRQVIVPVIGDLADEPEDVVFLNLANTVGATLARTRAFGTIVGDDFHSDLRLSGAAGSTSVAVDQPLTYSLVLVNDGPRPATGVSVSMPVSAADVSSITATSSAGACVVPLLFVVPFGNVNCDGGTMAPGSQVTFTVSVTPKRPGSLLATFTASSGLFNPDSANNTVTLTTSVIGPVVELTPNDDAYTVRQGAVLAGGLTRIAQVPHSTRPWSIHSLTDVDGTLFFIDPVGRLNARDGIAGATTPLTSAMFDPRLRSSRERIAFNGSLFFAGYDPATGTELWKSDGTPAGTGLFKDIQPGALQSSPRDMVVANGTLFFIADMVTVEDGVIGFELWRSDGTAMGTALVRAFRAPTLSLPFNKEVFPRNVDGTLFFKVAYGPDRGVWKSDGTAHGTVRVADLDVQGKPVALNGSLIFLAWQNNFWHPDLWLADASGARLLKENHETTANPSKFDGFTAVNGQLYFGMTDYAPAGCGEFVCVYSTTRSVWTSDGTPGGTRLVKTFPSFTSPYRDHPPFVFNGSGDNVLFNYDGDLWKSDGTAAGTTLLADVQVLPGAESASSLTDVNGTLYFTGQADGQRGLWKTDGTTVGTVLVKAADNLAYAATELTAVDGGLYFVLPYDDGRMPELWIAGLAPSVLANDTVVTTLAVSAAVAQAPSHGTLAFHDDGTFVYRPEAGFTGNDSFAYTLTAGTVTSPAARVTIHVTPAPISISVLDASVVEGNDGESSLVFNVMRSGDTSQVSSVGYSAGGGTATASLDYAPVSGTLTFAPGETTREIVVPIAGDVADEPDEVVFLNLSNGLGATLARTRAFGTIVDDDVPAANYADTGGVRYPTADASGAFTPVFVEFTTVTEPGFVAANAIPGPPLPAGFALVSQVFDVTTTASFTGPVTVCISADALKPTDRLFHFDAGQWVDVTASALSSSTQMCGRTSTLSPFAIVRPVTPPVSYGVCLLYDPLKPKKSGSTVPIAVQLCDANGRNYSSPDIALTARGVQFVASGDMGPAEDSGNANPDAGFRYDAARAAYVFNLKTTGLAQGIYRLTFTVGANPAIRAAEFRVR